MIFLFLIIKTLSSIIRRNNNSRFISKRRISTNRSAIVFSFFGEAMSNENSRRSDPIKVRSRRWTLLCWMTGCLLLLLLVMLVPLALNRSKSIHLLEYRSSLVQCGQAVVREREASQLIDSLLDLFKENDFVALNERLANGEKKLEMIRWFETVLKRCLVSKDYSMHEQERPTLLRRFISFSRREIFYLIGFFTSP